MKHWPSSVGHVFLLGPSRHETLTLFSGSRLCITSIETRNTDTLQWVTSLYYVNRNTKHRHSSVGHVFVLRQSRHETLTLFSGSRLFIKPIEARNTDTLQWVTSLYYVNRDTTHWHPSVGHIFLLGQSTHEKLTSFSGSRLFIRPIEARNTDTLQCGPRLSITLKQTPMYTEKESDA
jgi:hypothetical protein